MASSGDLPSYLAANSAVSASRILFPPSRLHDDESSDHTRSGRTRSYTTSSPTPPLRPFYQARSPADTDVSPGPELEPHPSGRGTKPPGTPFVSGAASPSDFSPILIRATHPSKVSWSQAHTAPISTNAGYVGDGSGTRPPSRYCRCGSPTPAEDPQSSILTERAYGRVPSQGRREINLLEWTNRAALDIRPSGLSMAGRLRYTFIVPPFQRLIPYNLKDGSRNPLVIVVPALWRIVRHKKPRVKNVTGDNSKDIVTLLGWSL
ncbi:hypothetical protein DFS33DRAFT_1387749 [Desarmillaria ectypa]|nr:hypothetical protein DFS33DRAFT_1387749 [Desarmillaria ectypa]